MLTKNYLLLVPSGKRMCIESYDAIRSFSVTTDNVDLNFGKLRKRLRPFSALPSRTDRDPVTVIF